MKLPRRNLLHLAAGAAALLAAQRIARSVRRNRPGDSAPRAVNAGKIRAYAVTGQQRPRKLWPNSMPPLLLLWPVRGSVDPNVATPQHLQVLKDAAHAPKCHSRSTHTCFATPAGSSSPMMATTHGLCSTISATGTSSTRSDTPKWRQTGSRTFGEADLRPWASWCRSFRARQARDDFRFPFDHL